tara:strand:+ start:487 stop:831 length:345 start_codon:yes stop_codon:yes gene_type:complete
MGDNWIPEILYEEGEEGQSSAIPFIMVPAEEEMPKLLYIFESRVTDESEPGMEGEEIPIVEWDLHQYADMLILKDGLDTETYDKVRECLGLEPMAVATVKGQKITDTVRVNLTE